MYGMKKYGMKNVQIIVGVGIVTALIAIIALIFIKPLTQSITMLFARFLEPGSISKTQALANNCNGKNSICVISNGKIVNKPITNADVTQEQQKYASAKDQHVQYAINVAAAVSAIRAYTHIPNLNLIPLNNGVPTHITYYCSPDKKCWAVDNQTHQVVPNAK